MGKDNDLSHADEALSRLEQLLRDFTTALEQYRSKNVSIS